MFHGHLDFFPKPPLGGRPNTKPGAHGTQNAHNHWFILFYHVWRPSWIEAHWNSIWLRARDHTTRFCRYVGTAFGHFLLGSQNFMVTSLGSCVKWLSALESIVSPPPPPLWMRTHSIMSLPTTFVYRHLLILGGKKKPCFFFIILITHPTIPHAPTYFTTLQHKVDGSLNGNLFSTTLLLLGHEACN